MKGGGRNYLEINKKRNILNYSFIYIYIWLKINS